jgi:hypothetical protein
MKAVILAAAGLALAACNYLPGASAPPTPAPSPARADAFVAMVEGSGCELHQQDNDALLDPLGFSDAEASAIAQQLLADGRAEINAEGNLVLLTENCV